MHLFALEQSTANTPSYHRVGHVLEDILGLEYAPQFAVGPIKVILAAITRQPGQRQLEIPIGVN